MQCTKYLAGLASLFFSITSASAQQFLTLNGRLADQHTRQPLPYGSVALYHSADSTALAGVLTDESGTFRLDKIAHGRYYLVASYVGYQTASIGLEEAHFTGDTPLVIRLAPGSQALDALEVRGNTNVMESRADRQVFRADKFLNAKGATALDVLRNTPSLTVDSQGNISWRGSNAFMVLVNGKPVQTDPQLFLTQLPANTIERIELITSPSARYDPDGKGGIINIITRSVPSGTSVSGNIQGGFPSVDRHRNSRTPVRFGADFALGHRKGKWEIDMAGNYLRNDMAGHRSGDVNTTIEDIHTSFPSEGERSFMRYSYTGRASLTFTPDTANVWSLGVYSGYRMQSRRADIVYHNTRTYIPDGSILGRITYFNSNVARKSSRISLVNLDYTHTFPDKSAITLSGLAEKADIDSYTYNINLMEPEREVPFQTTENPGTNPLTAFRAQADYTIPLKKGKLEAGAQYRHQVQRGAFQYLNREGSGEFELIPEFSSTTRVGNDIYAAYLQYGSHQGKVEYSGGLRYEYAERTFTAAGEAPRRLDLSNLFPSLSLAYKITPSLDARAGYNRRVQRSTNNELNPFPEREHSETLESGDPDILPEFVDLTEAGVIYRSDRGTLSATLYHQRVKNVVNRVNSVYNDTIINRIFTNAGVAVSWGAEISTSAEMAPWWQFFAGINAYQYRITGSLFDNTVTVNSSGPVYSVNSTSTFRIAPSLHLQWAVNYLSKRVTAQGEDSRFVLASLSAKKTFLDGRMTATLQWQNMDLGLLKSNRQRITTSGRDFYTTTNYIHETDMILLNLSYAINQFSGKKSRLPKSEFGEREF